jgi:[ribosomal protein S18]-alanine N-acetyltransferase
VGDPAGDAAVIVAVLSAADVDAITALEERAHPGAWSRADVAAEHGRADAVVLGARDEDGALRGWCCVRRIVDEAWLLEIAVDPARRRRGVARALVDAAVDVAAAWGVAELWLEVRGTNEAARALYAARGFVERGARKGYYPARAGRPADDAVLLSLPVRRRGA